MADFTQEQLDALRGILPQIPAGTDMGNTASEQSAIDAINSIIQKPQPKQSPIQDLMASPPPENNAAVPGSVAGGNAGISAAQTPEASQEESQTIPTSTSKGPIGGAMGALNGVRVNEEPSENADVLPAPGQEEKPPFAPASIGSIDMGKSNLANQQGLQDALDQKRNAQFASNLGRSLDVVAGGIGHVAPVNNPVWGEIEKQGDEAVKDYFTKVEFQKQDPSSPVSQGFKGYLRTLGLDIKGDLSAAQAEQLMPMVFKHYEAQQAQQLKRETIDKELEMKKSAISAKQEDSAAKLAEAQRWHDMIGVLKQQGMDSKSAAAEAKATIDKEKRQNAVVARTQSFLESSRSTPDVKQALLDKYNIGKAELLLKTDPNKMSAGQLQLLVSEVAKIAKGGVPDREELRALKPSTLVGEMADIWSKFSNNPTPKNAGEFIKQYGHYLKDLKRNAEDVISKKVRRVVDKNRGEMGEDHYQGFQDTYQDMLGAGENTAPKTLPQPNVDSDALDAEMRKRGLLK